eukprot:1193486-Prorocentrum_minimum.AAC.3
MGFTSSRTAYCDRRRAHGHAFYYEHYLQSIFATGANRIKSTRKTEPDAPSRSRHALAGYASGG